MQFKLAIDSIKPDVILHLASSCLHDSTEKGYLEGIERDNNLINILEKCTYPLKFIFISSMSCFKPDDQTINPLSHAPSDFYGMEKSNMVKMLKDLSISSRNIDLKIIYPSSIYGKGQEGKMFLPSLLQHLKRKEKMFAFGSKKYRDFIHVNVVSNALVSVIKNFNSNEGVDIFINSGILIQLGEIAAMVCDILKLNIDDVINFKDNKNDETDFQLVETTYNYFSDNSPNISLHNGLMEMFSEI